jgi:hypothetical protein
VRILAVDPGTEQSAWVVLSSGNTIMGDTRIEAHRISPNSELLVALPLGLGIGRHCDIVAFEKVESFGMAVGREVFDTVFVTGRMFQMVYDAGWALSVSMVPRRDVKLHLCGQARAKDANIRQALIDKFGGKEKAVGTKKAPGPLYGIKSHEWAALALAVTVAETKR